MSRCRSGLTPGANRRFQRYLIFPPRTRSLPHSATARRWGGMKAVGVPSPLGRGRTDREGWFGSRLERRGLRPAQPAPRRGRAKIRRRPSFQASPGPTFRTASQLRGRSYPQGRGGVTPRKPETEDPRCGLGSPGRFGSPGAFGWSSLARIIAGLEHSRCVRCGPLGQPVPLAAFFGPAPSIRIPPSPS